MSPDGLIAYLDGECDAIQVDAIEQALEQEEALRVHLAALVRQRLMLAEVCAAGQGAANENAAVSEKAAACSHPLAATHSASRRRLRAAVRLPPRRRPAWWMAAAAGILLAVGVLLLPDLPGPSDDPLVQVIIAGDGVSCLRGGQAERVHIGSLLPRGARLTVPAATFVDLRFADGSVISVAGDSTVVLLPQPSERLHLERGTVSATVTPQPPGTVFAIGTAHGIATVIGTRFTLTATPAVTVLMVEQGRVRLAGRAGDAGLVLAAGEGARIGASGLVALTRAPAAATTVATSAVPSASGVAVLPGDPWAGASVATDSGLGVPRELFSVSGQSFKQALRITTPADLAADPRHTGEYALRVRIPTTAALAKGDAVLATLWLRSGDARPAQIRLVVEESAASTGRSLAAALTAEREWRKVELPFQVVADAAAGTVEAQLWLGHPGQTIEVAGLTLTDHGPQPLRMIAPQATYAGRSADAPWRAAALARIAGERRTRLSVQVEDAYGSPLPQAMVAVRVAAPLLRFGTAVAAERLLGAGAEDARYRDELVRRFTSAAPENALKWAERERDPSLGDRAVAWLTAHRLPVRGHALVWPRREQLPDDLRDRADDPVLISDRLDRYLQDTLTAFRGRLTAWDVVNDPYSADLLLSGDDLAPLQRWFATARRIDPDTPRFLNLYGVLDDGGADRRRQDYYERLIAALLATGTPLDGLGLQCHQDRNLTPPARLQALLARFARFALPIHITEFEVDLDDEGLQADYTRDALTVFASEPAVQTVLAWGFWAGDHHRPQAAMLRPDWSEKPNGQVWNELVLGSWSGTATAISDAQGACVLTSMRGGLEFTVRHAGRTATLMRTVTTGDAAMTLTVP